MTATTVTVEEQFNHQLMLRLALRNVKRLRKIQADYNEACEADYKAGYRPHYCIHGMNLWVDYDPICGPCEDGYSSYTGQTLYKLAIDQAWRDVTEFNRRVDLLSPTLQDASVPSELKDRLRVWMVEPIA